MVGIFDPACELLPVYTDSLWLWGVGLGVGGVEFFCGPYSAGV